MKVHDTSQLLDKDQVLEKALDSLTDREDAFAEAAIGYAEAESEYRIQYAKEFLKATGTEKARHAEAIVAVENLLRERDKTEAVKEFTREKLRDAQAVVSARQSLLYADTRTNRAVG